jgi:hypothetical protein
MSYLEKLPAYIMNLLALTAVLSAGIIINEFGMLFIAISVCLLQMFWFLDTLFGDDSLFKYIRVSLIMWMLAIVAALVYCLLHYQVVMVVSFIWYFIIIEVVMVVASIWLIISLCDLVKEE